MGSCICVDSNSSKIISLTEEISKEVSVHHEVLGESTRSKNQMAAVNHDFSIEIIKNSIGIGEEKEIQDSGLLGGSEKSPSNSFCSQKPLTNQETIAPKPPSQTKGKLDVMMSRFESYKMKFEEKVQKNETLFSRNSEGMSIDYTSGEFHNMNHRTSLSRRLLSVNLTQNGRNSDLSEKKFSLVSKNDSELSFRGTNYGEELKKINESSEEV